MSMPDAEAQIVDLQSRLAYQERALETLDAALSDQALRLARLTEAVERLARRMDEAHESPSTGHERPPHY